MSKRKVDLLVLSDIHLGTYGCQAEELVKYLKSIQPGALVLNGDIIDIWQFSKRYWPRSHMQVLKEIVKIVTKEIPVYYLPGNHDELLRKFSGFSLGNFHLQDQLVLELNDKRHWFFHGDVFDASLEYAKWLAKLGAVGYDFLILINSLVNWLLVKIGREKMSFSKRIKNSVKSAVNYISDFEQTAATHAIERGYEYVICGHIHQPQIKYLHTEKGDITYLNSGDWIENRTALEYHNQQWAIHTFDEPVIQTKKKANRKKEPPDQDLAPIREEIAISTIPDHAAMVQAENLNSLS